MTMAHSKCNILEKNSCNAEDNCKWHDPGRNIKCHTAYNRLLPECLERPSCKLNRDSRNNVCCKNPDLEKVDNCVNLMAGRCPSAWQVPRDCCPAPYDKYANMLTTDHTRTDLVCCNAPCTAIEQAWRGVEGNATVGVSPVPGKAHCTANGDQMPAAVKVNCAPGAKSLLASLMGGGGGSYGLGGLGGLGGGGLDSSMISQLLGLPVGEGGELLHEAELNRTKYFHLKQQPALIKNGTLRGYQVEGVSWMVNLRNNGLHGILADEMGLGKTLQTIALLAHIRETEGIHGVHLIIVPKSTIINWCREFAKWCPCFNVLALQAATKEDRKALIAQHFGFTRKNSKDRTPSMDVIVCSYEICMIEKAVLRKIDFEYIIVDEAHRLKNNASKFSAILRKEFTSRNRLLITGTPLQNNLIELWSLLNFLLPDLFNSAGDFEAMFDFEHSEAQQSQIFEQLRVLLAPFLLRRLKKNAVKDLPPKTELIIFCGMAALQTDIYKKLLLREMSTMTLANSGTSKKALLNLVMQLRKC